MHVIWEYGQYLPNPSFTLFPNFGPDQLPFEEILRGNTGLLLANTKNIGCIRQVA